MSNTPTVVDPSAVVARPWRNGGGHTRELWSEPSGAGFDWRLSIADIETAGQFSRFPGVDRTLVPTGGGPVALTIDGRQQTMHAGDTIAFAGEAAVMADPKSPARVLNLMSRRGRCRAALRITRCDGTADTAAEVHAIVLLAGALRAVGQSVVPLGAIILNNSPICICGKEALLAEIHIRAADTDEGAP